MELLKFQSHFGPIVSGHVATHKLPKSFQHFLILTMSSKLSPKDQLNQLLPKLNGLIKKLPMALPCGSKDGPLANISSAWSMTRIAHMNLSIWPGNEFYNTPMMRRSCSLPGGSMAYILHMHMQPTFQKYWGLRRIMALGWWCHI